MLQLLTIIYSTNFLDTCSYSLQLQNGDLQYSNGFHNGNGSALYNRGRKNKINSDFTSCSVTSNLQCPFIDSSSEQEDLSEHQYYHPETEVGMGYSVIMKHDY